MKEQIREIINYSRKDPKNKELYSFLKGKDVEIVGPAETVLNTKRGKEIETKDVIIRFNTSMEYVPFNKNIIKDIGERTDILYVFPAWLKKEINERKGKFLNALKHSGLKFIATKPNSHVHCSTNNGVFPPNKEDIKSYFDTLPPEDKVVYDDFNRIIKKNNLDIKLVHQNESTSSLSYLLSELKESTIVNRTGFLPIYDCIAAEVNSVHVSGMTFYHKGGHMFRNVTVNSEGLHPLLSSKLKSKKTCSISAHDSIIELQLMKEIKSLYSNITLDKTLDDLLTTDNPYEKMYSKNYNKQAKQLTNNEEIKY